MNVVVATDCTVLRAGFERLLDGPEFSSVRFVTHEDEVLELIESQRPDILIVPTASDSLAVCAAASRRFPDLPILALSTGLDDASVRGAIEAGANGFLFKDVEPSEFRSAVTRLVAGESVLDPRMAGRVIAWATHRATDAEGDGLSSRELEVLQHVAEGEPNKRIARRMRVSENTVKTYLRRAYRKLGCHTRASAAAKVARRGLL